MPPTTAERRNSRIQAAEIATILGGTLLEGLRPVLEALANDKENRHTTANIAQAAIDLATTNKNEIVHIKQTVAALLGDGTGENGKLAIMSKSIRDTEASVNRIEQKLEMLTPAMVKLEANTDKSRDFMSGWKGVAVACSVIATMLSIIGGIAAVAVHVWKN